MERSNPLYTPPGITLITSHSAALKARADMTVYIPPSHDHTANLPIVTLLHGVNASHWAWTFMLGAHVTLQRGIDDRTLPPMGLVMPSDGLFALGSGYVAHAAADYEAWIVRDVIDDVMGAFPGAFTPQSPRVIAGLSMGGYGALRIGAKYADVYAAFAGLSSVTDLDQIALFTGEITRAATAHERDHDLLYWLTLNRDRLPPFRFDCGRDDFLIEQNRELHRALETAQIDHEYAEYDGAHNAAYWTAHIDKTLAFFANVIR
jgi:enterochelin esterase-like enzyme